MEDMNNEEYLDKMSRTIFARNISFDATVDDLKAATENFNGDSVLDVKLPTDRETGRSRGYGFIEFKTAQDCQNALANAQVNIHDRDVILAQSQPKSQQHQSGRGRGGFRGGYNNGGGYNDRYQGNNGGYQGGNNYQGGNQYQGHQGGNQGGSYNRFQGQGQPQGGGFQQGGFQQQQQPGNFGGQY